MGIPYYGGMKNAAHTETRREEDTMHTATANFQTVAASLHAAGFAKTALAEEADFAMYYVGTDLTVICRTKAATYRAKVAVRAGGLRTTSLGGYRFTVA